MSLLDASVEAVRNLPVGFEQIEMHEGAAAAKHAANRSGSRLLLMALTYHHGTDANIRPPKGWVKREPAKPTPKEVFDYWFREDGGKTAAPDIEPIKIEDIKRVVCRHFGLMMVELVSNRRSLETTRPRQIAMLLCKRFTGRSLPEIGRRFGGRDHTTVLNAIRRIESLAKTNWLLAYDLAHLEVSLAGRFQCDR